MGLPLLCCSPNGKVPCCIAAAAGSTRAHAPLLQELPPAVPHSLDSVSPHPIQCNAYTYTHTKLSAPSLPLQLPIDESLGNAHAFHYTQVRGTCAVPHVLQYATAVHLAVSTRHLQALPCIMPCCCAAALLFAAALVTVAVPTLQATPVNGLGILGPRMCGLATPDLHCSQPSLSPHSKSHTYPIDVQCTIWKTLEGDQDVWKYDKRFHTSLEDSLTVPPIETPPTFVPGKWKTIEGEWKDRAVQVGEGEEDGPVCAWQWERCRGGHTTVLCLLPAATCLLPVAMPTPGPFGPPAGKPISEGLHHAVEQMIGQMNAGIKTLKPLPAR